MFETYGEELEFVRKQEPKKIWTIVDGDNGNLFYMAGFHTVNRIGYFVTEVPWVTGDEEIEVEVTLSEEEFEARVDAKLIEVRNECGEYGEKIRPEVAYLIARDMVWAGGKPAPEIKSR
jgi:hypothetical protein